MIEQLREEVKNLLSRDDVKYAIGYEKGSYGFRVTPIFAYSAEDVDKLQAEIADYPGLRVKSD